MAAGVECAHLPMCKKDGLEASSPWSCESVFALGWWGIWGTGGFGDLFIDVFLEVQNKDIVKLCI